MNYALEARGIIKYLDRRKILDNVSIEFRPGSFTGIIGPNGAGKTTLLKILVQIMYPSSGEVIFHGSRINDPRIFLDSLGSVIESPEYFGFLTCRSVISLRAELKGFHGKALKSEVNRVSGLCGIEHFLDERTGNLSTGMRQKVALAAAFVGDPDILILDEPLSGIDIYSAEEIIRILENVKSARRTTAIITFHEMSSLLSLMDNVAFMVKGKIARVMESDNEHVYYCAETSSETILCDGGEIHSSRRGRNGSILSVLKFPKTASGTAIPHELMSSGALSGFWRCNPVAIEYEKFLEEYYSDHKPESHE